MNNISRSLLIILISGASGLPVTSFAENTGAGNASSPGTEGTTRSSVTSSRGAAIAGPSDSPTRGSLKRELPDSGRRDEISGSGTGSSTTSNGSARTQPDASGNNSAGAQNSLGSGGMAGEVNR